MNIVAVATFFVIALVLICYSSKETFIDIDTTAAEATEYPDEISEVAEVVEVAETTEAAEYSDEYPDEDEEISGYDEPLASLSMKKIE
jgi:hypothetical protein